MIDPVRDLHDAIAGCVATLTGGDVPDLALERPASPDHGDYATSVAMRLAPLLGRPPREIASDLASAIASLPGVASADVAGPGFINLRLDGGWYRQALDGTLAAGADFGRRPERAEERTLVEFVSSNPTGDLTIGSARNAAYGDSVARLVAFAGAVVTREYYINDAGNQVALFGRSVQARRLGADIPEGGYPGPEVAEIAAELDLPDDAPAAAWAERGAAAMVARIRASLSRMRVDFDLWTSEQIGRAHV